MTLMAHGNTKRASETEIIMAPCPDGTDTWKPLAHGDLLRSLNYACKRNGIGVIKKEYSMNPSGLSMFGNWTLDIGETMKDQSFQLGFRNNNAKVFKVGIVAGTGVLVCDNMCFSGEFLEFHMHTSGLDLDRVRMMADKAVMQAIPQMAIFAGWRRDLNNFYLPEPDRKAWTYDLIANGIISGGQFQNYQKCLEEEVELRKGYKLDGCHGSIGNLYEGVTRLMKGWNMLRSSQAMARLNGQADQYIEMRKAA